MTFLTPSGRSGWFESKVSVTFGDEEQVMSEVRDWDGIRDVVIVVAEGWPHDQIEDWCDKANQEISGFDLTLMAFVPGAGPDTGQPAEEAEDWTPLVDEEYAMVFIQVLSDLNAASESLEASGYYENCTPEFRKYVSNRREGISNARQEEVNEEARKEDASVHEGKDGRQEVLRQ